MDKTETTEECSICLENVNNCQYLSCENKHMICSECFIKNFKYYLDEMVISDDDPDLKKTSSSQVVSTEVKLNKTYIDKYLGGKIQIKCPTPSCYKIFSSDDLLKFPVNDIIKELLNRYHKYENLLSYSAGKSDGLQQAKDMSIEEIDNEKLRVALNGEAKQCPKCGYGPILRSKCDSILTHHDSIVNTKLGVTIIDNRCPMCSHIERDWKRYNHWDGKIHTTDDDKKKLEENQEKMKKEKEEKLSQSDSINRKLTIIILLLAKKFSIEEHIDFNDLYNRVQKLKNSKSKINLNCYTERVEKYEDFKKEFNRLSNLDLSNLKIKSGKPILQKLNNVKKNDVLKFKKTLEKHFIYANMIHDIIFLTDVRSNEPSYESLKDPLFNIFGLPLSREIFQTERERFKNIFKISLRNSNNQNNINNPIMDILFNMHNAQLPQANRNPRLPQADRNPQLPQADRNLLFNFLNRRNLPLDEAHRIPNAPQRAIINIGGNTTSSSKSVSAPKRKMDQNIKQDKRAKLSSTQTSRMSDEQRNMENYIRNKEEDTQKKANSNKKK